MFLFQLESSTVDAIQKIGLPSVIVVALSWFLFQVWKWVIKKIDEKDKEISDSKERRRSFDERLLSTQRDISDTLKSFSCIAKINEKHQKGDNY